MGNAFHFLIPFGKNPVHPHVHGERTILTRHYPELIGSSPRAWGTPPQLSSLQSIWRFIPTCMGNARSSVVHKMYISVHPHVHGERQQEIVLNPRIVGSSPRAWGTLVLLNRIIRLLRFIPTCMGNAIPFNVDRALFSVHPHVHGERILECRCSMIGVGSSPRAWGTLYKCIHKFCRIRFIPTCMGNALMQR